MNRGRIFLVSLASMVFAAIGQASPACTTNTFAYYETHPCNIGMVSFDFSPAGAYTFTADDYNPGAANVTVTPVGTGLIAGQPVGFTFSNNGFVTTNDEPLGGSPTCCEAGSQANPSGTGWIATNPDLSGNGNSADLNLTFNAALASRNPNLKLLSTQTALNVFIWSPDGGGTYITMGETATDRNNNTTIGGAQINAYGNTDSQSIANGGSNLTSSASFSTATTSLQVNKDILITSTFANTTPNSAALNSVTETFIFGNVPEPGSFVLVGLAVLLFAGYRWRRARLGISAAVAVLAVAAPHANAAPLCINVNFDGHQSMYAYEQLGSGGCMIGNDLFSNFTYSVSGKTGNAAAPATTGGSVTNLNPNFSVNPISSPGVAGFRFQPVVQTNGGGSANGDITVIFSFDVKVGENLLNPAFATADTGSVNGTGTFAGSKATLKNGASTLGTINYPNNGSSPIPGNCCSGIVAGTTLLVTNTFTLAAPKGSSSNSTHLSNFTDTFNQTILPIPEPAVALLMGSGLIGLAALARKRSARRA
jgi:hypothetical protein